jgi:hypothetical protein
MWVNVFLKLNPHESKTIDRRSDYAGFTPWISAWIELKNNRDGTVIGPYIREVTAKACSSAC